jgi:hypothetical protein
MFNPSTFCTKLPGGIPLKLKSLAVITLFVLGCSAAFGQSFSLGFLSYDPIVQFCDYEVITVAKPFAAGTHNLTTVCGLANDAVQVGFTGSLPASAGAPLSGAVIELADNTFDAQYASYTGCQINWVTKSTASTQLFKYGWAFYDSCAGGQDYLGNFGYLSSTLGAAAQKGGAVKTSFGGAFSKAKHKK